MDPAQAHEMNKHGRNFGMSSNDFYSFLTNDLEEAESYKLAKEEEQEKALFSGRRSRRERRLICNFMEINTFYLENLYYYVKRANIYWNTVNVTFP